MGKVLAVFAVYADTQTACLCVTEVGAAADLKVLLLARRPRFNVHRLNLQVCEVARAALERADRDIHAAEQVYGVLPELIIPLHGVFRLADDNHFLLFKLVNTVNAALLDAVCTFFLTEARRIAGQRERQFGFRQDLVDEFTDHGVLAGTDEIQVFTLDLVHHGIHFRKAHNAGNDVAANHIRRDDIREAAVNHKIARIRDNGGVQTRDVAH